MDHLAREIAAIGDVVGPEQGAASAALYADLHEREPYAGVRVARDLRYGTDERHRLDVFAPEEAGGERRPVVVFAHGGGFVGGDKAQYDNVGLWACRSGFVGATMTYRLAPEHRWPAGAEDVGSLVAWLREHAGEHGGDPDRIVLMGHSAGATHMAGYVGMPDLHPGGDPGVLAVVLVSGAYDLVAFDIDPVREAYFGSDEAVWRRASPLPGLVASELPVLFVVAEHDPPVSHRQAALLFQALWERDRRVPRLVFLPGHNHFTEVFHLNTGDRLLGMHIERFVRGLAE